MRRPATIEHLYLDFDSFFASVEQQLRPELRGRPVGIIPSDGQHGGCIAASREAKAAGIRGVVSRREMLEVCPDIALVPQRPMVYRRAHNAAVSAIGSVVPVSAVKSIDEMHCRLDIKERGEPMAVAARLKRRLADTIGPHITASIGFAANPHLAKIACKMDKPDGATVWDPDTAPVELAKVPFSAIPGIGSRMEARLHQAGITDMAGVLATSPKQLRQIWGNVHGERLWYAFHGYDVCAPRSKRSAIGHGRVLPASWTREPGGLENARRTGRLLATKAARRARREGWVAREFSLSLKFVGPYDIRRGAEQRAWWDCADLPGASDDHACLAAFERLWARIRDRAPHSPRHLQVQLGGLQQESARQLDLLDDADSERRRWKTITRTVDELNARYCKSAVTQGPWTPPPGGHAGGKIAFTRVPEAADFW